MARNTQNVRESAEIYEDNLEEDACVWTMTIGIETQGILAQHKYHFKHIRVGNGGAHSSMMKKAQEELDKVIVLTLWYKNPTFPISHTCKLLPTKYYAWIPLYLSLSFVNQPMHRLS